MRDERQEVLTVATDAGILTILKLIEAGHGHSVLISIEDEVYKISVEKLEQ